MGARAIGRTACAGLLACALLVAAHASGRLSAQVAPNRATGYLHPTDVRDARALWVNPAGLGTVTEASVYAELVVADPGAKGRLQQLSAGFNSRGLSFGYQRDVFEGGVRGSTYRLGLGGASEALAGGFAVAYYRGNTKGTGWDLGLTYAVAPALTIGGVLANIGQPRVRGLKQRVTMVPGFTWRPLGVAAALSAHSRVTPDSVIGYAFGLGWQGDRNGRLPVAVFARLDTDGGLRRGAFSLGVSIGGPDRVGTVISTPGDVSGVDAVSLYGLSTRNAAGGRGGGRR
ncbi:MAG TPA: hypothetical protein VGQ06_05795 [Gemmatimonadales bacterium]|jgi:hypothetical protein|nr:hypothetical protein [Gemmatimonadales bacterium]